jgi:large subunit ribosomal protein L31e
MIREFAEHHMKTGQIKIDQDLSHAVWERGIRSPPRKIRVKMAKTDDGYVMVSPYEDEEKPKAKKEEKVEAKEKPEKKEEKKAEETPAKKEEKKPEPKADKPTKKPEAKKSKAKKPTKKSK